MGWWVMRNGFDRYSPYALEGTGIGVYGISGGLDFLRVRHRAWRWRRGRTRSCRAFEDGMHGDVSDLTLVAFEEDSVDYLSSPVACA